MKVIKAILLLALVGLAAAQDKKDAAAPADAKADAKEAPPAPTGASKTTVYEAKGLPKTVPATSKYEYNAQSGVGAFQVWNGGLELPKVINLGGSRTTRQGLRGLLQATKEAAAKDAAADAKEAPPAPTGASKTTVYEAKGLPKTVPATSKYEYNAQSGVGAFQVWNGGLELPKVINLGGSRTTRQGLRGLLQAAKEAAAKDAAADAKEAPPAPTGASKTTVYEAKGLPKTVPATSKYEYNAQSGVGAFQVWNGGLELPKVINLGGSRTTRQGLRGLLQAAKEAAAKDAAADAKEAPPAPTGASKTTVYEAKGLPKTVPATSKYEYNAQSGVGAFQVWNGGLELPKVINLGGSRTTRQGLRGLLQAAKEAAAKDAAADAKEAPPAPTGASKTTVYEAKGLPKTVPATSKYEYNAQSGVGAFQVWNGGLELPKVINLGGSRTTRQGLRGLLQATKEAAAKDAAADAKEAPPAPTGASKTTVYEAKGLPKTVPATSKYEYNAQSGVGAFQVWNGGLELPKVINLGGSRTTRQGLRG